MLNPSLPSVLASAIFKFAINVGKFSKSAASPPRSSASGYSQSISTPSKLYVDMKETNEVKNARWFAALPAISLKVVPYMI